MSQALFTGIYNKFTSIPLSSFYNSISGKLYLVEAPQNTDYPLATYNLIHNEHDWSFTSNYEESTIEFILLSDSTSGATEITDMYNFLDDQFDNATISLSSVPGYTNAVLNRENSWLNKMPGKEPDKSVWQYNVTFTINICRGE